MSDATTAAPAAPSTPAAPTAQAPTPVAAPVTLTPEPAPAQVSTQPDGSPQAAPAGDGTFTYQATGNPALDVALGFFGKQGIAPDSAAAKAALAGDFTLLAAELATKGDKATGWEQHIDLAQKALTDAIKAGEAKAAEVSQIANAVSKAAGTDWSTVQTWARTAADPAEKEWFNSEIKKGGVAAKAAISYVTQAYVNANNSTIHPPSAADPGRGNGAAGAPAGLSAKEYAAGVAALYAKSGGRDVTRSDEYAALQNQRLLGKRMGK